MDNTENGAALEALLEYLKHRRGFDFTCYKRASLERRIRKRMDTVEIATFANYQDYLEVHPTEFANLFNTILINVTSFFRDEAAWEYLAAEIIPRIIQEKAADEPIRIWCAGCASGEEAYTLAMLWAEALGIDEFRQRVKIYATDVDEEALAQARHASYHGDDLKAIPPALREKYFELQGNRYLFRLDLRRVVIFGRNDLTQDAPISRLDLLSCRNTLMYFTAEAQTRIMARLHFAVHDAGYLFLGKAEMLLTHANLFAPVELQHRVFTKVPAPAMRHRLVALAAAGKDKVENHLTRQVNLWEKAFQVLPEALLVVDHTGQVQMINAQAQAFFRLTPNDVGRPLQDLEISYRPLELRSLIEQARTEHRTLKRENIVQYLPEEARRYLEVQVVPLMDEANAPLGTVISFSDTTNYRELQQEAEKTKQDLETAYEELQSTNEELETTNEELQSTNEELETTNEELQSTNEELETMNEELQSTNEELQTMNDELRERTTELNETNAFLESILVGLRAGVVAVNRELEVVVWNPQAEDLWGLRGNEVQGQPFLELDIGLPVARLEAPLRAILTRQTDYAEVPVEAINRRGQTITCHVTCTPRRGGTGNTAGVILLMKAE